MFDFLPFYFKLLSFSFCVKGKRCKFVRIAIQCFLTLICNKKKTWNISDSSVFYPIWPPLLKILILKMSLLLKWVVRGIICYIYFFLNILLNRVCNCTETCERITYLEWIGAGVVLIHMSRYLSFCYKLVCRIS